MQSQSSLLLHQNFLPPPLWKMNNMSIETSVGSVNLFNSDFIDKPTHTDVLLGRGVGTNRHAGNTNFRLIVSQFVVSSYLECVSQMPRFVSHAALLAHNTHLYISRSRSRAIYLVETTQHTERIRYQHQDRKDGNHKMRR